MFRMNLKTFMTIIKKKAFHYFFNLHVSFLKKKKNDHSGWMDIIQKNKNTHLQWLFHCFYMGSSLQMNACHGIQRA